LDEANAKRSETISEIERNNEELTTVAAVLLDDREYLKELAELD